MFLALLALASAAHADDDATKPSYRAVVDRVDLEPAIVSGYRLRVYLSALAIEGQLLDLTDPKSIRLYVGASEKKVPYALGTYDATNSDTAIVIIVEATVDFGDALPMIAEALDRELLATLNDRAQVAVMTYGESTGSGKLVTPKLARGKLAALASDGSAGDPALLDTIDRALQLLRKASIATDDSGQPRPLRKMIVVIGDGRDRAGDKDRVTRAGMRAAKEGVRIHSIAYSPSDVRRPLLVLGELSKKSLGTFRWPGRGHHPTPDSWSDTFKQLTSEISKQYVLTYFVTADDDVAGKRMHVVTVGRTEATSNDVKIPDAPTCAGAPCETGYCGDHCVQPHEASGGGVMHWILLIGGIGLGGMLVLGLVGFAMSKLQGQPQMPGVPRAAPKPKKQKHGPAMAAPGLLPNGRPIPGVLIMSGPRSGERLLLRNGFLIGKQPGSDLLIEDGYTSSHHAQIVMDAHGNCRLYDQGSTNGTFVNGVRVTEYVLEHGVTIRIGSTELRFLAQ
ncbi:MAG: domain containing protein [Myxococcales bacterium]|nr:domain containing protein [Myxococcales bacterium]